MYRGHIHVKLNIFRTHILGANGLKAICFIDACVGIICADACQALMLHKLGAFLVANVKNISPYQRTCILRPIWISFTVDSKRSTQQKFIVHICLEDQTSMNMQMCKKYCAQAHQGLRCTSFYAPATICEVHLLQSQTHTQKCPNKMKYNPSKHYY